MAIGITPPDITRVYNQDSRELIDKYGKMVAPFFRLQINDKDNNVLFSSESSINQSGYDLEGLLIYDVTFDETDCQTSMINLTMANPNMDLQDGLIFTEGNTIDLWMGYDGLEPDYMGRGFIVEISPTFDVENIPTFNVVCYDISHFLMEEGRAEIVPEGTAWYDRQRRTASTGAAAKGGTSTGTTTNNPPNNPPDNQGKSKRNRNRNPGVSAQNGQVSAQTTTPNNNTNQKAATNTTSNQQNSRMEWVRWKQPRRGRNSGKVWREKTDSEIVEAIFGSYGIISYASATSESRKTSREVAVDEKKEIRTAGHDAVTDNPNNDTTSAVAKARQAKNRNDISVSTHGDEQDFTEDTVFNVPEEVTTPGETRTVITERKVTQKNGTSDWDFIKELAKKHGYIVFTFFHYDSGKWIGYWGPDNNTPQQQTYTFRYASGNQTTLARVKPTISLREQKTEIDLQYVDPRYGKEQILRVDMDSVSPVYSQIRRNSATTNIDPIGGGPEVTLTVFGKRTSVQADRVFTSAEDARDWLVSFWIRHARDFCRVEGETLIGLPEMRCRQHHIIEGLGRISGNFFITKTTHKMSAGSVYKTTFSGFKTVEELSSADVVTDSTDLGELPPPGTDEETNASL